jgi:hypothetical protein
MCGLAVVADCQCPPFVGFDATGLVSESDETLTTPDAAWDVEDNNFKLNDGKLLSTNQGDAY